MRGVPGSSTAGVGVGVVVGRAGALEPQPIANRAIILRIGAEDTEGPPRAVRRAASLSVATPMRQPASLDGSPSRAQVAATAMRKISLRNLLSKLAVIALAAQPALASPNDQVSPDP